MFVKESSKRELFRYHCKKIIRKVKRKYDRLKVLIWDDMLRDFEEEDWDNMA